MSLGELLVILLVALIVFSPEKLPMVAKHLGQFLSYLNRLKFQLTTFWQAQLQLQQLKENQEKAAQADLIYKKKE